MDILNISDYKDEKENLYFRELQKYFGRDAQIGSVVFEKDRDPAELLLRLMGKKYDLIVHCGACMFNRRLMLSRIMRAQEQGVPITNYGLAIAQLQGILDNVSLP